MILYNETNDKIFRLGNVGVVEMAKKRVFRFFILLVSCLFLSSCANHPVQWNGNTVYTHITMALDETDLYQYVGAVDYIFVGVVQEANTNITEDNDKSTYKIEVTDNLKGELADEIECSKHGGILKDGTMLLYESDNLQDVGLPEVGSTYIFMAYAQPDGSLLLSEFWGNVEFSEEELNRFYNYIENEIPYERERFSSEYDAS